MCSGAEIAMIVSAVAGTASAAKSLTTDMPEPEMAQPGQSPQPRKRRKPSADGRVTVSGAEPLSLLNVGAPTLFGS